MNSSNTQVLADNTIERRGKTRLDCRYPAQVRFHSLDGIKMEKDAIISNLSASGMYLRCDQCVESGEGLFIVARVLEEPSEMYRPFLIASRGVVVRCESQADGEFGVAVKVHQNRFLYLDAIRQTREPIVLEN